MINKLTFFLVTILASYFLQAHAQEIHHQDCKFYLSKDDIVINEDGLFAYLNNEWNLVKGILSDDQGIYIAREYLWWTCDYCYWSNFTTDNFCNNCGKYYAQDPDEFEQE